MKRIFTLIILLTTAVFGFAQSPTETLSGSITADRTLTNDKVYLLDGFVFVKNNATLTIQPGTIIRGVSGNRSTLIITRGAKIIANGTANQPIVFTSDQPVGDRNPGDWGGLVILGKARINRPADCTTCPGAAIASAEAGVQNNIEGDIDNANGDGLYGGTDDNDNSGSLQYVRIEYAGVIITTGNEINGFTLGGIGRGTTINHVQVSYANDDSFEWFGGSVNAKHLISVGAIDDDFDTDFGFSGRIQFGVAQRDSNNFDTGNSPTTNGFESDNDAVGINTPLRTKAIFSNMTIVGPLATGTPLAQSNSFQNGARLRRATQLSIFNSVFMGFPTGILVDGDVSNASYNGDTLRLKNNIVAGTTVSEIRSSLVANDNAVKVKFESQNDTINSADGILNAPFVYGAPDFFPANGSVAVTGASFADTSVANGFFTPTTHIGAFGKNAIGLNDHWDWCWSSYNPQNNDYDNGPLNYVSDVNASFTYSGTQNVVTFTNTSTNGVEYGWDFGDGNFSFEANPTHTYPNNDGQYEVRMIAIQPCGIDTAIQTIDVLTGINEIANVFGVTMFPNPARDLATINFNNPSTEAVTVSVFDMTGKTIDVVNYGTIAKGKQNILVNTANYSNGVYFIRLTAANQNQTLRLVVAK